MRQSARLIRRRSVASILSPLAALIAGGASEIQSTPRPVITIFPCRQQESPPSLFRNLHRPLSMKNSDLVSEPTAVKLPRHHHCHHENTDGRST